jgi:hypothetical protein
MSGLLVVLRLDETNRRIADYLVLPAFKIAHRPYLRFSDENLHDAIPLKTVPELISCIKSRLKPRRATAAPTNVHAATSLEKL